MWRRFQFYLGTIQTAIWRFVVRKCLPFLAGNKLEVLRRLRYLATTFVWLAVILTVAAPFLHLVKAIALAGLMFDVAGVIRLFLDEEWDELLQPYRDEKKYPYGPPSYITREMFADTDTNVTADSEEYAVERYYYYRRGFLLIILGFIWQAIAVILV